MRRNRGECLLASCAALGCMFVVAASVIIALVYFLKARPSDVRPMVHQTPVRSVEIQTGSGTVQVSVPVTGSPTPDTRETPALTATPLAAPTPVPETTPLPEEFAPTISADGFMLGMSKPAVRPSKTLIFKGNSLVEVHEARSLQVDSREWKAGDKIELAQLRSALPTRRESQKSERDGAVRHSFPQAGGVEVQVWIRDGRAQKFALLSKP